MSLYRALRHVFVAPGVTYSPDNAPFKLDDKTARFLLQIGAVEKVEPSRPAKARKEEN